jgi:hypothetical protein
MQPKKSSNSILAEASARWRNDICLFIEQALIDPDSNQPFKLYKEERQFLQRAFPSNRKPDAPLPYTELCYSIGKKGGKTALATMIVIHTALYLSPLRGEIYLIANDLDQAQSRVFRAVAAILTASPLLRGSAVIKQNTISFKATGTTITAVANDYRGFAGANPVLNVFDESAYYVRKHHSAYGPKASLHTPARSASDYLFLLLASKASHLHSENSIIAP